MTTFAEKVMDFYDQMKPPTGLPTGVEVLNPYVVEPTKSLKRLFMEKFFSDSNKRILIIGINPGRLGGGLTGVDFTDPIHIFRSFVEYQMVCQGGMRSHLNLSMK